MPQTIHFTCKSLRPFSQMQEGITKDGKTIHFKINTFDAEDGGGKQFLINYRENDKTINGYIHMETLTGFLNV